MLDREMCMCMCVAAGFERPKMEFDSEVKSTI